MPHDRSASNGPTTLRVQRDRLSEQIPDLEMSDLLWEVERKQNRHADVTIEVSTRLRSKLDGIYENTPAEYISLVCSVLAATNSGVLYDGLSGVGGAVQEVTSHLRSKASALADILPEDAANLFGANLFGSPYQHQCADSALPRALLKILENPEASLRNRGELLRSLRYWADSQRLFDIDGVVQVYGPAENILLATHRMLKEDGTAPVITATNIGSRIPEVH